MADRAKQQQFTELYQREHSSVLRFVLRRLPAADVTRAEDVTQDAFFTAWRNLEAVPQDHDQARAWLYSAARNGLLHERRSLARRGALAVRIADYMEHTVPSPAGGVETLTDLARAWRSLDANEQETIALTTWEGLTSAQAAQVLGITAAAYRIRLMRARNSLRKALEPTNNLMTANFSTALA